MSRRLISRISRWRRSQSPNEPLSPDPASFSQGAWRFGRLTPEPPPAAGSAGAASFLRGGTLSRLDTFLYTRFLTLPALRPWVKSLPPATGKAHRSSADDLPARRAPAAPPRGEGAARWRFRDSGMGAGLSNLVSSFLPMTISRTTQSQLSK